MFGYYLRLAWQSIKRNYIISSLMVLALAVGVGSFMITMTIYYYASSDPIPEKSDRLYAIQLDAGDIESDYEVETSADLWASLTYLDAKNLMEEDLPVVNKMMHYRFGTLVLPDDKDIDYFGAEVRATNRSFFNMFDVDFLYGGSWSEVDDEGKNVIILTEEINDKLFAGEDSVGQTLNTNDGDFKIVGVIKKWNIAMPYFEPYPHIGHEFAELYTPLNTFVNREPFSFNGSMNCWKPFDRGSHDAFLQAECAWVGFWVELASKDDKPQLLESLNNYTTNQKTLGRFQRPTNNFATDVNAWLKQHEVAEGPVQLMQSMSFLFLLVCLINTIGLLAAKFIGKSTDVSVRRALGASKSDIFKQNIIEVSLIGFVGGLFGLLFAVIGLRWVRELFGDSLERFSTLDPTLIIMGVVVAIAASILSGIYPSWRAASASPAANLKTQ